MVTVPGMYLDGIVLDNEFPYLFIDPTDTTHHDKGLPPEEQWCSWKALDDTYPNSTAARWNTNRIQNAQLLHPCNSFEEALHILTTQYPELLI